MVNFKSLRKIKIVKWFIKKTSMDKSDKFEQSNRNFKGSKPTIPPLRSSEYNIKERFVPLAAKDSAWVGIEFLNPNFRSHLDEDDVVNVEESKQLFTSASDGTDAIFLLFPGLNKIDSLVKCKEHDHESPSTTDITKLLVGQKAAFKHMKSSRRLMNPFEKKLTSVAEVLQEDKNQSETDISTCATRRPSHPSDSDTEFYDDEEVEPTRSTHIRRRKRRSDGKVELMPTEVSSASFMEIRKKPSSRLKQPASKQHPAKSGESSFADDDEEEKSKAKNASNELK